MLGLAQKLAVLAIATGLVSACSNSPEIDDFFTMGKSKDTLDASKATTHQALSMPPNLQLRPPSGEKGNQIPATAATTKNSYVAPKVSSLAPAPTNPVTSSALSSNTNAQAPTPSVPSTPTVASVPSTPAVQSPPVPSQNLSAPAPKTPNSTYNSATAEQQGIYQKYGISTTKADGTKKSQIELNAELQKKTTEQKRQNNPNYGTIFNMGSLWKDG